MTSQFPPIDVEHNRYKINENGEWVIASPKGGKATGEWGSTGGTDVILSQVDARINKLTQAHLPNTPQECQVHMANLSKLRDHVLGKLNNYYQNSEASILTGWFWTLIRTIASNNAKSKFNSRIEQLTQLQQRQPEDSIAASSPYRKAQTSVQSSSKQSAPPVSSVTAEPAMASSQENITNPREWANFFQKLIITKVQAEAFMSDKKQVEKQVNIILWHDQFTGYRFSIRKRDGYVHTGPVTFNYQDALMGGKIIECAFKLEGFPLTEYQAQSSTVAGLQEQIMKKAAAVRQQELG